jgi:hypothetical protein
MYPFIADLKNAISWAWYWIGKPLQQVTKQLRVYTARKYNSCPRERGGGDTITK